VTNNSTPVLTGRVVTLAPLAAEHAEVTFAWRQGDRAKYLNRGAQTIDEQRKWIIASGGRGDLNFIILFRDAPVGMIALHDTSKVHRHVIIGRFLIGEPQLVGTAPVAYDAELALCDYAFDTLQMHKIHGDIIEGHETMLRWRQYLGWAREGVKRDHYLIDGAFVNVVMMSLLEDDYRRKGRPRLRGLVTAGQRGM